MQSVVSVRGQTVIPKEIRKALGMKEGTRLHWAVTNGTVKVRVLPEDSIGAMKGALKHLRYSTADLLAERQADHEKEEAKLEASLRQ